MLPSIQLSLVIDSAAAEPDHHGNVPGHHGDAASADTSRDSSRTPIVTGVFNQSSLLAIIISRLVRFPDGTGSAEHWNANLSLV